MPAPVAVASTLFVVMTCLIAPRQLHAQVLAGRVLEAGAGTPVAGAQLRLLAANGSERGTVVTDSSGWFQLALPNAGRYSLAVEHIGYARFASNMLDVPARQTVTVEIRLGRDAIPLEPLVVTARRDVGRLAEFRQRVATEPAGRFVTRAEIDRRPTANVSDFLRMMPSVTVLPVKRNNNPSGMTTYVIMMRGSGSEPAPAGADAAGQGMCSPAIFVDGNRVGQSSTFPIDDLLQPGVLEGIEVYSSFTTVPAQYRTLSNCGAVLLWTRANEAGAGSRRWVRNILGLTGLGIVLLLAL